MNECGNYLLFKNFYTLGEIKLTKNPNMRAAFALPFCAAIRASRAVTRYVQRIDEVLTQNRKLKPVLITLTVKMVLTYGERADHLLNAFRKLLERRRDFIKKGRGYNEFCKVQGAMYSYENTYNEKQVNGIRIFTCLHWWTAGLISKNLRNIGKASLVILTL